MFQKGLCIGTPPKTNSTRPCWTAHLWCKLRHQRLPGGAPPKLGCLHKHALQHRLQPKMQAQPLLSAADLTTLRTDCQRQEHSLLCDLQCISRLWYKRPRPF